MQGLPGSRFKQLGFSLLEVMVAGVILSSGLAGVAALILTAVAGTADVADRSTANRLADSLVSLVEVSPSQTSIFLEPAPEYAGVCDDSRQCSASEFAGSNYRLWQQEVRRQLPGASATVCYDATPEDGAQDRHECDGNGLLYIKIFWQQRPGSDSLDSRLVKALPS